MNFNFLKKGCSFEYHSVVKFQEKKFCGQITLEKHQYLF